MKSPIKSPAKLSVDECDIVMDSILDIAFILDKFGKVKYVNKSIETMLGFLPQDIIGKSFIKFVPGKHIMKYLLKLKEVFSKKEINSFITQVYDHNNRLVDVEINGKLISYNDKLHALGLMRDIRERLQTENELSESRASLRVVLENSPLGICVSTIQGNIIDSNQTMRYLLNIPSRKNLKQINLLSYPPLQQNGYAEIYQEVVKKDPDILSLHISSRSGEWTNSKKYGNIL